jgi:hypothetical protein
MKNFILLLFLSISTISYSQVLQNTEWEAYFEGEYTTNFYFGIDTFYVVDYEELEPFSLYTESSDTFNINDLEETGGCYEEFGDYWGSYLFKIKNDTLTFEVIEDSCDIRSEALVTIGVFVKASSTSTKDLNAFNDVTIYPNPIGNDLLNIKSKEKLDLISIYDTYGQLLISSSDETTFDLSSYSSQLFFIELIKGNNREVKKIVKY